MYKYLCTGSTNTKSRAYSINQNMIVEVFIFMAYFGLIIHGMNLTLALPQKLTFLNKSYIFA